MATLLGLALPLAAASFVCYDPQLSTPQCHLPQRHAPGVVCKASGKKTTGASTAKGFGGFGTAPAAASGAKGKKQKPVANKHPRSPEWRAFENWLIAKGAQLNGVELADCGAAGFDVLQSCVQ